jgi:Zn-finger nucleic acid-binding protein
MVMFDIRDIVSKLEPGYAFKNSSPRIEYTLFTLPDFMYQEKLTTEVLECNDHDVFIINDECIMDQTLWSMRGESGKLIAYHASDETKMFSFEHAYEDAYEDDTIAKFMGDIDAILTLSTS